MTRYVWMTFSLKPFDLMLGGGMSGSENTSDAPGLLKANAKYHHASCPECKREGSEAESISSWVSSMSTLLRLRKDTCYKDLSGPFFGSPWSTLFFPSPLHRTGRNGVISPNRCRAFTSDSHSMGPHVAPRISRGEVQTVELFCVQLRDPGSRNLAAARPSFKELTEAEI